MSKDIERFVANVLSLDAPFKAAGLGSPLDYHEKTFGEVLKMAAVAGIDLSAKCLRPAGEPE